MQYALLMLRCVAIVLLTCCGRQPSSGDVPPRDAPPADAGGDAITIGIGAIDGQCAGQPGRPRVLVYSYENLWRHLSNYYARAALLGMCASRGFSVTTTNDPHAFSAERLASIDVVVFGVTSGNGMDARGRAAFEGWVRAGGGTVGLEAASATETDWPWFGDNLGAVFANHAPGLQRATVRLAPNHPILDGMPASFELTDQWYVFQSRPEDATGIDVLMTLDETTLPADYPNDLLRGYRAIGWTAERYGGRVFYTAIGDNPDDFQDPNVLELVGRGVEWAAHAR